MIPRAPVKGVIPAIEGEVAKVRVFGIKPSTIPFQSGLDKAT